MYMMETMMRTFWGYKLDGEKESHGVRSGIHKQKEEVERDWRHTYNRGHGNGNMS